ncbi:lipid A-modifier LpxR family protein [Dokdonia genika]|uniref:Lipid A-modifier LpxR family protein n=1 Tax=Dokdonia genika TaxID=308113 RepID=A0ABV9L668_9FLAO
MQLKLLPILVCILTHQAWSQGVEPASKQLYTQEFSIQHDNDFLFAIDRYYTAGSFLRYSRKLKEDFIFKNTLEAPLQYDIIIGQETYTPRELFVENFDSLERPYAGYLFARFNLTKAQENSLYAVGLEIGLAGEQSGARTLQLNYHNLIGAFMPVWSGQIANSTHINLYGSYVKDYVLPNSNLFKNAALQSSVAIGSRRMYARQEALLYIGDRAQVSASSAYGRVGNTTEFYGVGGVGVEYVVLNALIEGNPLGDSSPFTLPAVPVVFSFKAGGVYRSHRNTYRMIYKFRTKETKREGRSQYVTFEFARRF